jgi:hypothetical protein
MILNGKQLWTLEEAARVMEVNPTVLVALADDSAPNRIAAVTYRGRLYFDLDDIQTWLRRCTDSVQAQSEPEQAEEDFSDVLEEKLGQ